MAQTKFDTGQNVEIVRTGALSAPSGSYRIVSALPMERGPQQYRVRHKNEAFDRIVDEARLKEVVYE